MTAYASPGLDALQPTLHGRWEPRRALTLSAARRRTTFVRVMRFGFMAAIAVILAVLVFQLIAGNTGDVGDAPEAVSADVRMINPRFTGRDENLTPYAVTADVAIRRRGEAAGLTELEAPRLDYNFINAGNEFSSVLAETGTYDAANRVLDLFSNVNFATDTGYTFASNHARIHLSEERVTGNQPVEGTGPMGTIRADRYEIHQGGNRVIFDGNVHARITQGRTEQTASGDDQ